jgi:hypothetical protein
VQRGFKVLLRRVGLEPTTPSVNRVALIWVNKYSLRVSPETRVVAPHCIFSTKLEPNNSEAIGTNKLSERQINGSSYKGACATSDLWAAELIDRRNAHGCWIVGSCRNSPG